MVNVILAEHQHANTLVLAFNCKYIEDIQYCSVLVLTGLLEYPGCGLFNVGIKATQPPEGATQSQIGLTRTSTFPLSPSNSHLIPIQSPPSCSVLSICPCDQVK